MSTTTATKSPEWESLNAQLKNFEQEFRSEPENAAVRLRYLEALVDADKYEAVAEIADPATYPDEEAVRAYAAYQLSDITTLRALVTEKSSIAARLSLAQAEYKAGNLKEAHFQLLQSSKIIALEDEGDLLTNLSAVGALRGVLPTRPPETFDDWFNHACALLTRGAVNEAISSLERANQIAELDEDRTAVILQVAYAHAAIGEGTQAIELLRNVEPTTKAQQFIADSISLAATYRGNTSIEGVHRALLSYDSLSNVASSLNANQRAIATRNYLKLRAYAGMNVTKAAAAHAGYFDDLEPLAVMYAQTRTPKQLAKLALSGDRAAQFAQAAVSGTNPPKPKNFEGRAGDFGEIVPAALVAMDEATAAAEQSEARKKDIVAYFESLDDPAIRQAGLSVAGAGPDFIDVVDSIEALVGDIDADALDSVTPEQVVAQRSHVIVRRKHRSGKRKLPADFDPEREPDPQRWLAKQDRSDYKPKRKKGQATQATQGAATTMHSSNMEEQKAPQGQVVSGPKKKANKKKKGKK